MRRHPWPFTFSTPSAGAWYKPREGILPRLLGQNLVAYVLEGVSLEISYPGTSEERTMMNSQFSDVKFSSVALAVCPHLSSQPAGQAWTSTHRRPHRSGSPVRGTSWRLLGRLGTTATLRRSYCSGRSYRGRRQIGAQSKDTMAKHVRRCFVMLRWAWGGHCGVGLIPADVSSL